MKQILSHSNIRIPFLLSHLFFCDSKPTLYPFIYWIEFGFHFVLSLPISLIYIFWAQAQDGSQFRSEDFLNATLAVLAAASSGAAWVPRARALPRSTPTLELLYSLLVGKGMALILCKKPPHII
ncbi:hypothetical protein CEXT_450251 [Caerostris extrusa]|uniref:Uncharacterized protein n=1 Tax=Caerostris extrusa TaxID=172846 RepID=A0AAV4XQW7_CAEEX|nr:hypothetical protein CEXT_450251 [Caerostris extrusa]